MIHLYKFYLNTLVFLARVHSPSPLFCVCVCAWLYLCWFTLNFVCPTLIRDGTKKYGLSTYTTAISEPTTVIFASTAAGTNYNPRWVKSENSKTKTRKCSSKISKVLSVYVCVVLILFLLWFSTDSWKKYSNI